MSAKFNSEIAVIGIDIGKNSFHIVGLDRRGAIVLRHATKRRDVPIADLSKRSKLQPLAHLVGAGRQRSVSLAAVGPSRRIVWAI